MASLCPSKDGAEVASVSVIDYKGGVGVFCSLLSQQARCGVELCACQLEKGVSVASVFVGVGANRY